MNGPPTELDQARWEALIDREALGEALDAEQRGQVLRYEAAHPELAHERMIFEATIRSLHVQLDQFDQPELERDAAAALAALARYRSEREQPEPEPLTSPSHWWIAAALATAAGVLLWGGLRYASDQPSDTAANHEPPPLANQPKLATTPGPVDALPPPAAPVDPIGGLSMIALAGEPLELGAALDSTAADRACVSWSAPTAVACFEGKVSTLASPTSRVGERTLRLDSGRLVVALAPLGPGQRFTVKTSVGTVSAIGTVFAIEIHEGQTWVTVLEGRVELRDPTVRALSAGRRTSLRGEVPGDEPTPLPADSIPSALQELVSLAKLLRASPGDAGLIVPATPEHSLRLDGHALEGPAQLLLAPGPHRLEWIALQAEATEPIERTVTLESGAVVDLRHAFAPAVPSAKPSGAGKAPSAKQLAEAAQRHREDRDYDKTAALYQQLLRRYPDSPEATNVPVRLGDLLASQGDHQGALDAYAIYLERGAKQLAREAEFGRIEALRALGRRSEERAAIEAFLATRPDDYRKLELEAWLQAD